MLLFFFFVVFG